MKLFLLSAVLSRLCIPATPFIFLNRENSILARRQMISGSVFRQLEYFENICSTNGNSSSVTNIKNALSAIKTCIQNFVLFYYVTFERFRLLPVAGPFCTKPANFGKGKKYITDVANATLIIPNYRAYRVHYCRNFSGVLGSE